VGDTARRWAALRSGGGGGGAAAAAAAWFSSVMISHRPPVQVTVTPSGTAAAVEGATIATDPDAGSGGGNSDDDASDGDGDDDAGADPERHPGQPGPGPRPGEGEGEEWSQYDPAHAAAVRAVIAGLQGPYLDCLRMGTCSAGADSDGLTRTASASPAAAAAAASFSLSAAAEEAASEWLPSDWSTVTSAAGGGRMDAGEVVDLILASEGGDWPWPESDSDA
jgi:hypothetical protein